MLAYPLLRTLLEGPDGFGPALKAVLANPKLALYRGVRTVGPIDAGDPLKGAYITKRTTLRNAAGTGNTYASLIDEVIVEQGLPRRRWSTVCTTDYEYAVVYAGDEREDMDDSVYVVIPEYNATVASVNSRDLWDTRVHKINALIEVVLSVVSNPLSKQNDEHTTAMLERDYPQIAKLIDSITPYADVYYWKTPGRDSALGWKEIKELEDIIRNNQSVIASFLTSAGKQLTKMRKRQLQGEDFHDALRLGPVVDRVQRLTTVGPLTENIKTLLVNAVKKMSASSISSSPTWPFAGECWFEGPALYIPAATFRKLVGEVKKGNKDIVGSAVNQLSSLTTVGAAAVNKTIKDPS